MFPDLILTNARILTMNPEQPRASALALCDGKITAIGERAEIEAMAGPLSRIMDAGDQTLLPGFVESHMHLGLGGTELGHLHLTGLRGFAAVSAAFRAFAQRHPTASLLMAQGADHALFDHPITRQDLDLILADRPLAMTSHDHHTVRANTAALRAAGLLAGYDTPQGHEVVMGADGTATGELREFEAFAPIIALGGETRMNLGISTGAEPHPSPTEAERAIDRARFRAGMAHCAAQGITSIVTMDGNRYTLEILREIQREGGLLQRVKVPFHFKPLMALSDLTRATDMQRDFNDDWLQSGFVKMFMDGVLDSRTAYMLHDYPDHPGHRSAPLFTPDRFNEIAAEIDRLGLQIAVHAIGDGAVRTTIDGYEAAIRANGRRDSRHRIEHIELIAPDDIARLGALGITASLQPSHPPGAMDFPLEPAMGRIGQARWPDAFLCRDLAQAGAPIALASDWPVADVSVLRGIQAALTRRPYAGARDQRLTLPEALHGYTAGGAWAAHRETLTGQLAVGMAGDLVLLNADIEKTAPEDIGAIAVAMTICGGRITYQADRARS